MDSIAHRQAWWKESVVYQVYPSSFKDSNGDGIGDIQGVISELDHIKNLGVDVIWLSPIFQSPQKDMGYDVSDYRSIHPPYGTLIDVEELISEAGKRGMKIVMDLVVNHTSDQHEWFKQSMSSKDNPYRDWYIWRKPKWDKDGKPHPPNNWRSLFQGSAWEFDSVSQEYYLHLFAKEQPDLNWENPAVIEAVHDIMRFWLDKGAKGFRMDVINLIAKWPGLPDGPVTDPTSEDQDGFMYYCNGPRLHEYLRGLGDILNKYDGFSVGEMPFTSDESEALKSVQWGRGELNMIFQFDQVELDRGPGFDRYLPGSWTLKDLKQVVNRWQTFMYDNNGWNALFTENHDVARSVSRFTTEDPIERIPAAKMLAMWMLFQSGTPFVYQGQELGMINVPANWPIEEYKDVEALNNWERCLAKYPNDTAKHQSFLEETHKKGRDNARTPVTWTSEAPNGGFCPADVTPWMRVHGYEACNAASQTQNPESVYSFWRSLLALRRQYKSVLVYGSFALLDPDNPEVFAYERKAEHSTGERVVVVLNWSRGHVKWNLSSFVGKATGTVLLSNYARETVGQGDVNLEPWEAVAIHFPGS